MLHTPLTLSSLSPHLALSEDGSSLFRCIIDSTAGTRRTAFLVQPSLKCGEQTIWEVLYEENCSYFLLSVIACGN